MNDYVSLTILRYLEPKPLCFLFSSPDNDLHEVEMLAQGKECFIFVPPFINKPEDLSRHNLLITTIPYHWWTATSLEIIIFPTFRRNKGKRWSQKATNKKKYNIAPIQISNTYCNRKVYKEQIQRQNDIRHELLFKAR